MTEEELFKNGYEVKEGKLLRYFGFCTSIELPQEINVLGENCFAYNEDINSFTGSKNLKIIEQNAFYGCCNLERVCLCDGLERIEKSAFSSCGLKEISIPQSVKEIEEKAFLECHSLNKIKLPETLESISDNLFDSCGELKRIEIATVAVRNSKLTIFDEPEAGIDLWSFRNLNKIFKQISDDNNSMTLVISHQEKILNMADKVILMENGNIVNFDSCENVMNSIISKPCCKKEEIYNG